MRQTLLVWAFLCSVLTGAAASAQDSWVQIEALPSLAEGETRARAYGGVFPNVSGFELTSGWYAIVLGPFAADEAERQLDLLRAERLIPRDSYIPEPGRFVRRFWPVGAAQAVPAAPAPDGTAAIAAPDPLTTVAPLPEPEPEESPREARASEGDLSGDERKLLQTALQWEGAYSGKIDGAIGGGTRNAMAAWQLARGYPETGVLTTRQRAELVSGYETDIAAIGLRTVREEKAGIEIAIPANLVGPPRYAPPFVEYDPKDSSGFQVLLISRQGDEATLFGLYDIMQTLEIVPLTGERERQRTSFVLTGKDDKVQSYTQAELRGGFIKGFTLVWRPEDGARAVKVLEAMKASFTPFGDRALDDSLGEPLGVPKENLLAGLEVRRPTVSRTGFFIDGTGSVLTTTEVLQGCGRITIDGADDARIVTQNAAAGLAVLAPAKPLAPRAVAEFRTGAARAGTEVAVAGYPYEDTLDAPVVTFGTLAAAEGLNGETDVARLDLAALAGDAGGPVIDQTGAVVGMLMPRGAADGRVLPAEVGFARSAGAIVETLAGAGLAPVPSDRSGAMAAEDVAALGRAMTVLVSCWE